MPNKFVLTMSSIMIVTLLAQQSFAKDSVREPHSHAAHDYEGSVFNKGKILTLSDAIQRAITASPHLKSVQNQLDATKGAALQAGYRPNPALSFEAENILGNGAFSGTDSAELTFEVSQTIEIGGKRSARQGAANAITQQIHFASLTARLTLERDVHIAYANVLAEAESVKLAIEQEQLANSVLTTVSKRVEAAADSEIQRSKADVAYAMSVIARQQEQQQLAIAKKTLARLWGATELEYSLDHSHFYELQPPEPLTDYQRKLSHIPDMQRLHYLKAEKQSLLKLEHALAKPDPNISLGLRDFRESDDQALLVGVSIPIPVFNQNKGNIAKARAQVHQAENEAQQAVLLLEQQLNENWQTWSMAYVEASRLNKTLLPVAEKSFSLARSGYEKGKFSYLGVLDAQRTLFDARSQYHDALKRYHAARAHVERLTTQLGDKT